ncbi:checkpoint protein hus1 [Xylaria nigripes]|nr:checkpoint protein hus1 [Xylaria nigripes]
MRFKTNLRNIRTFTKLVSALSSLEKVAWVRFDDETIRFTVIPDTGTQVWASLSINFLFDNWTVQSAEPKNTINLELPLLPLQRALKSAINAVSVTLRLTKKQGLPILSMTITTSTTLANPPQGATRFKPKPGGRGFGSHSYDDDDGIFAAEALETNLQREHEKVIRQDIPIRVLHPETVESIMQPRVREADVHIQLPPLLQLKAISDRFTKLAHASRASTSSVSAASSASPKLELSANMHGELRLRLDTDTLNVESWWHGLQNPELDPSQLTCPIQDHPSTRFRKAGRDKWATVRVDGKDWSKVLSVGRIDGRVIACFADDHALILYVYIPHLDDPRAEDSVMTYYVSSYSL